MPARCGTRSAGRSTRRRASSCARADGDLVGAVTLVRADSDNGRHRGEIRRLVVRADQRGRGTGKLLLQAAEDKARALGITLLWLTTHAGTASDAFYERIGWTRSGVIPGWSETPDGALSANAFFYLEL